MSTPKAKARSVRARKAGTDASVAKVSAMPAQETSESHRPLTTSRPRQRSRPQSPAEVPDSPGPFSTQTLDRVIQAQIGRLTMGLSPASLLQAGSDWAFHLAIAPGKRLELAQKAIRKLVRLGLHFQSLGPTRDAEPCIEPLEQDRRFSEPVWREWPFNLIYQSFLLQQQWWFNATTGVPGVSRHHQQVVEFVARQLLDTVSPANFPWTNPQLLEATWRSGGANLRRGANYFIQDWERALGGKAPVGAEKFEVGRDVAVTPGKVVYRNRLIELIQYEATTDSVYAEPILFVPAWIMKYYILDLSPDNSMVRYLRDQGHTVFMISWKNPGPEDRELSLEAYRRLGVSDALTAIGKILPQRQVHAVGYCLGGTLLAIAAAAMARDGDERLKTVSLLAAQTDFSEAGELTLFIDESQVNFLENIMWEQGYLDTRQMAGAFQLLRSNDLIWSRLVHDYMLGERAGMTDLMAWNADATRMPYRMHSQYLRELFLNNALATGRYAVDGRPVAIEDIRLPIFSVATERDHIAPWRSVFKIHLLSDTDVTFVLTSGGHNGGIVSEPGHPRRRFRIGTKHEGDRYLDADRWRAMMPRHEGSWWIEWQKWLAAHSGAQVEVPVCGGEAVAPYGMEDAPGSYVRIP